MKIGLKDLLELVNADKAFKPSKRRGFRKNKDPDFAEAFSKYIDSKEKVEKILKGLEKKDEKKKAWHEEMSVIHVQLLLIGTAPIWGPWYWAYMKHLGFW